MTRTITKEIYKFEELSDSAKETAREWWRSLIDSSDFDAVIEDAVRIGNLLGIEFDKRRNDRGVCIWWSLSYSQGDGACFEGYYEYAKDSVKKIKDYAPVDEKLHRIAERLQKVQKENFYQLCAKVKQSGHYQHSGCTDIEVYRRDDKELVGDAYDEVKDCLRLFMDWIYDSLEEEDMWLNSDEQVDEAIVVNEYEFYENGEKY